MIHFSVLVEGNSFTEIDEHTREVPDELMANPDISKAVVQLEESAFTEGQLLGYDKFWDMVSTAKMQISSSRREGLEEGHAQGRAEGLEEGHAKGLEEGVEKGHIEERLSNARKFKRLGVSTDIIAQATGLNVSEIERL